MICEVGVLGVVRLLVVFILRFCMLGGVGIIGCIFGCEFCCGFWVV